MITLTTILIILYIWSYFDIRNRSGDWCPNPFDALFFSLIYGLGTITLISIGIIFVIALILTSCP